MKIAEIHLPYFKQGDDLGHFLSQSETVGEALEAHAEMLEGTAKMLREIKNIVLGREVEIHADTHYIQIEGPDDVIDALIVADCASVSDWMDEEFEEEDLVEEEDEDENA